MRFMTLAAGLLLSFSTWAANISLQIPEYFELVSINGKDVKGNFAQSARRYTLTAGDTLLELRYNDIQEAAVGDSHTNFRSAPVGVRFKAEPDHAYRLQAQRPANETQATLFAKNPRATVVDAATQAEVAQQYLDVIDFKKSVSAALISTVTLPTAETSAIAKPAPAVANDLVSQNLWYWWQQADEPTRKAFLKRIAQ